MSRAVEESNRRMLRARDAMDRDYAEPPGIPSLARIACVLGGAFLSGSFGATLASRRIDYFNAAGSSSDGDVPGARETVAA